MTYALLADLVVLLHFAFIIYVLFGGLLFLVWPRSVVLHLPSAVYGVLVEFVGWTCPLTPLEKQFRRLAGEAGFEGGFVSYYLLPIIYPEGLTRPIQFGLGAVVLLLNLGIYAFVYRRWTSRAPAEPGPSKKR